MAATREQIRQWFYEGQRTPSRFMIVVCDTFDWEDYPVFAESDEECLKKYNEHNGKNMQKVMEVYDLSLPLDSQMAEHRAFHLPKRTEEPTP